MKWLLLSMFLVLGACQESGGHNNHGYGYHYDHTSSDTKIRVRIEPDALSKLSTQEIDLLFWNIVGCTGIHRNDPPPLIVFVHLIDNDLSNFGRYYSDTNLILIGTGTGMGAGMQIKALQHELVHYLYADGADAGHDGPQWACAN